MSDLHGLAGKPDYVRKEGEERIPVERKSRALSASGAYEGEILQLAAYCLLVEERFGRRVNARTVAISKMDRWTSRLTINCVAGWLIPWRRYGLPSTQRTSAAAINAVPAAGVAGFAESAAIPWPE